MSSKILRASGSINMPLPLLPALSFQSGVLLFTLTVFPALVITIAGSAFYINSSHHPLLLQSPLPSCLNIDPHPGHSIVASMSHVDNSPPPLSLFTGVTYDLRQRIVQHHLFRNTQQTFTGKYNSFWLLYHNSLIARPCSSGRIAIEMTKEDCND
jgi:hypothetical protein